MYRGELTRDGHTAGATLTVGETSRLRLAWSVHLSGPVDGSAIVTKGHVVVGSAGGDLVALAEATGDVMWRQSGLGPIASSPAVDGSDVFVATLDGHVRDFSFSNGSLHWEWKAPGQQPAIWSTPTVFGDNVLVGIGSQAGDQPLEVGRIVALNRVRGQPVWELCARPACQAGTGIWSTPAIDSRGRAFVGLGNPEDGVLAFDAAMGKRLWQKSFYADNNRDLDVGATPVIFQIGTQEVVGVGSVAGVFNVFDGSSGAAVWSDDLVNGSAVHGLIASPAYDGADLYVASASAPTGMFALKGANGAREWSFATLLPVYSAPALGDHVLVFGEGNVFGETNSGRVTALSTVDEKVIWSYDTHSAVRSGPVIAGNLVVVGDYNGDVLGFRPKS